MSSIISPIASAAGLTFVPENSDHLLFPVAPDNHQAFELIDLLAIDPVAFKIAKHIST
jgi:hypothetical protein